MVEQLLDKWVLIGLLIIGLGVYTTFVVTREHVAIKKLGGRASVFRGKLPFGMDIAWTSIQYAMNDKVLEFWELLFTQAPAQSRTIELTMARQRFIFTADPENVKATIATQFEDYGKGETFHEDWKDFLGDSIFTTDGEEWRKSRNLIRPQFIKSRVSDLDIFEKHVKILLSQIGGQGQRVDISALFYRYTLDASTDFLLGESVGTLVNPQAKFSESFADVQRIQNLIAHIGPFNKLLPRRSFNAGLKVINDFIEPIIERALRLDRTELEEKTKSSQGYTFLHALVNFTRDRKVLRDQIVAVLLAGRDTTAGILSFTFQELSMQPRVVAKIRREILERVGPTRRPTYDDLKNMTYLQHTVNETLRKYPSVSANMRHALQDTTLPRGGGPDGLQPIAVLKGHAVVYSTIYMQRDARLFPPPSAEFPDVLEFSPERWDHWIPKSWHYIPFNGGPRICVGQQFALTEINYTIVRIMQRFERMEKYWPGTEVKFKAEIVLSPAKGVEVGFWEAGHDTKKH